MKYQAVNELTGTDIPITREEALALRELLADKIQSLNLENHPINAPNYIRLFNKIGKAL